MPLKFASGVKVISPPALTFTVPFVTGIVCAVPGVKVVPLMLTTLNVPPSESLSNATGFKVIAEPFSCMLYTSSTATGAAFTVNLTSLLV